VGAHRVARLWGGAGRSVVAAAAHRGRSEIE
jgi:hypothetical protein